MLLETFAELDEDEDVAEALVAVPAPASGPIPPLNVVILIVGSRGDVQPFIAFGKGLQKAGHRVRLATHVNFRQFITENGLEFYPLKGDPELLMNFMVHHPDMITLSPPEIARNRRTMELIYHSTWDACTSHNFRADVIVSNPPVHVHIHLSQRLQIPLQVMFTMPWSPTKDYRHPLAPLQHLVDNKASYAVVDRMVWTGLGGLQNDFRKKIGLHAISGGSNLVHKLKVPQIYCMSPHLAPKPTDWGTHIDVVGFWYLDLQTNYKPPSELMEFLSKEGGPPIYFGFGSIVVDDPKALGKSVIEGIIQSGQRAIISPGWAKLGEGMDLPPTIKLIGAAPHDWLFPKCAAVCHHGGAGTTAAGLKAGCPTIVVPFFGDQPFWGQCVAQRGVGPAPIPNKQLTPARLKEAILFCIQPEVKIKAKEFGEKLRNEDGVQTAVEAFHRKLPIYDGLWVEEIHENMRKGRKGWAARKLFHYERSHYTEKTGTLQMDIDRFECLPGWEWQGDWTPVPDETTDPEGWRYNLSFTFGSVDFHPQEEIFDLVRTRKLIRKRKYVGIQPDLKEHYLIYVDVIAGRSLRSKRHLGHSDPYCVLRLEGDDSQQQTTENVHELTDPTWKEIHWFKVTKQDKLVVECFDTNTVGGKLIGSKVVAFADILNEKIKYSDPQWYPLTSRHGKHAGDIQLAFSS